MLPEDHPSHGAKDTFYLVDRAPEGKSTMFWSESDATENSGVRVRNGTY